MRFKPWLVVLVICIAILVILGVTKFFQIKAAIEFGESFPEPSETVEAQRIELTNWQATISVIGTLKAPRELELRTEVAGTISEVGFSSGSSVTKKQLLLQLDISEEQARLQSIKPQIKLAQQNVERISGLTNKAAVSKQQADSFASQLAVAKAESASVKEMIANKTITAPFSGLTGLHDFEVGEYLPANTLLTKLVGETDTLWIDFSLPQQYSQFKSGTEISISDSSLNDVRLSAKVIAVEPAISESSRDLKARALIDNSQSLLKPGGVVRALVPVGQIQQVFQLPSTAVRVDAFGSFVFALQKDDTRQLRAVKRPIEVTAREGDTSIVRGPLDVGELIATKGSFKLREGLLVYQVNQSSDQQAGNQLGLNVNTDYTDDANQVEKSQEQAGPAIDNSDAAADQLDIDEAGVNDVE